MASPSLKRGKSDSSNDYQALHWVTSDAESLGFVKTLIVSTDKYVLNERRELRNTVAIEPDRLEQFGFTRYENRQSAS